MAFEQYQTSTSELLQHIQNKIRNYKSYFSGLKRESVGLGFLGSAPIMPAISVIPSQWTITNRFSGGKYNVGRSIEIQFYASGKYRDEAQARVVNHIDKFYEILVNDRGFLFSDRNNKPLAFNFEYFPARYESMKGDLRGFAVMQGTIPLLIYSREYRPKQADKSTNIVKASDNQIFTAVYRKLLNARNGRLQGVKEFRKDGQLPRAGGLTVVAQMEALSHERHGAGEDLYDFTIPVMVYSKLLPEDNSLIRNVDIAENVKELFEEDETFGGILWNSTTQSIVFGIEESNKSMSFYASRISFVGRKHRGTLFGNV